jgi:hypothetical protein
MTEERDTLKRIADALDRLARVSEFWTLPPRMLLGDPELYGATQWRPNIQPMPQMPRRLSLKERLAAQAEYRRAQHEQRNDRPNAG